MWQYRYRFMYGAHRRSQYVPLRVVGLFQMYECYHDLHRYVQDNLFKRAS